MTEPIKSGAKTTELWAQLGPYGLAFALLYGVLDQETIDLIKQSCSVLPDWAQALAALAVKVISVVGGVIVGSKAVGVTQAYTDGRLSLKGQQITREMASDKFRDAIQRALAAKAQEKK